MDFQDFAARETSALLARAAAESQESSRQRLQAFRSAINAATKALETALTSSPPQVDVGDLVARLTKAVAAESETAAQRVAADAKAAAQRAAADAKAAADALNAQIKTETKQKEALASALAESQVQADELRLELQTDKERIDNARHELAAARDAQKKLDAARAEAIAERDKEARARAAAETDAEKARAVVDRMKAELDRVRAEADKVRSDTDKIRAEWATAAKALDTARAENTKLEESLGAANSQSQATEAKLNAVTSLFKASATRVKALERAEIEHEDVVQDLEAKLSAARSVLDEKLTIISELEDKLASGAGAQATAADRPSAATSLLDDLLVGFETLSGATTISGVLTSLLNGLSNKFARAALFRVKGNRLEGQQQLGFDSKTDVAKLVVPLGMDSLLARAFNSGRIERLTGSELAESNGVPFGGKPSCAIALPIVVHGETLGIAYADDAGRVDDSEAAHDIQARFADALLQHSVALLMRLTTELRTMAELRTYASSLLSEMEQMYLSDVNAGKTGADLQKRLKDNLEYARSIYANRIALECPDAATLLDDQLAALSESQSGTPFGRDVAIVAGHATGRRKAEAS